jgi:hypothetical protein
MRAGLEHLDWKIQKWKTPEELVSMGLPELAFSQGDQLKPQIVLPGESRF